ncbi:MAG: hypothetical protein AAF281_11980 [Pseudomonadota bacterium]
MKLFAPYTPRLLVALAALMLSALSANASADRHEATCNYFTNQAFQDRRTGLGYTFRKDLAQDCADARVLARSPTPETRARAEAYLDDLETYRRVLIEMLLDRAQAAKKPVPGTNIYVKWAVQPVSRAGAYLIARRMGLVRRHDEWTDWRRSLASADPRFRLD